MSEVERLFGKDSRQCLYARHTEALTMRSPTLAHESVEASGNPWRIAGGMGLRAEPLHA